MYPRRKRAVDECAEDVRCQKGFTEFVWCGTVRRWVDSGCDWCRGWREDGGGLDGEYVWVEGEGGGEAY